MTKYIELQIELKPDSAEAREICCAVLGDAGFEGFFETDQGIAAYIDESYWDIISTENLLSVLKGINTAFHLTFKTLDPINWNKEWEKNFNPVFIDDICFVRAPFHEPDPKAKYDIVIMPKMAFGTGHHHTTSMMIKYLLSTSMKGKKILDMGSGTGIIAILASKLGATQIIAVDVDEWAYRNCVENIELNGVENVKVIQGSVDEIMHEKFDLILANINRNILDQQIPAYSKVCTWGGQLIISGFYSDDLVFIQQRAGQSGFVFCDMKISDNWIAARFEKT